MDGAGQGCNLRTLSSSSYSEVSSDRNVTKTGLKLASHVQFTATVTVIFLKINGLSNHTTTGMRWSIAMVCLSAGAEPGEPHDVRIAGKLLPRLKAGSMRRPWL